MEDIVSLTAPVKKQTRSYKLTKEQSQNKLERITESLIEHIGQPAILCVKTGRDMVPYLVELIASGHCIIARYKCYGPDGRFRCYLQHFPSSIAIMTGEQDIIFFDDI